jgi:hypothetical protein
VVDGFVDVGGNVGEDGETGAGKGDGEGHGHAATIARELGSHRALSLQLWRNPPRLPLKTSRRPRTAGTR